MNSPITERTCKQHPDRVGGISCQRCGEGMCPSCMHQASVGWHCPTCIRLASKEAAPAQRAVRVAMEGHRPVVTMAIMAISLTIFVWDIMQGAGATSGLASTAADRFSLNAPDVWVNNEWYRVVTSAFTHSGLMHVGFNMYILWQIGQILEGRFGSLLFGTIYGTGIIGGSLGAMLIEPRSSVVGASGAVFALMGVLVVLQYMSGQNIFSSGIGRLLMLNVFISFLPGISLGGHFGGLAVGALSGWIVAMAQKKGGRSLALAPVAIALIGFVALVALVPVIESAGAGCSFNSGVGAWFCPA